jgi:predicted TIM-barrel fold metal-dependent hydrolase
LGAPQLSPNSSAEIESRPRLEVIDAQLHCWEADNPHRPWRADYGTRDPVEAANRAHQSEHPITYGDLIARMDATGVDGALLVTPAVYGADNTYTLEAAARHPGRFAVVGRVDPEAPDIEERLASWQEQPGMLGIRLLIGSEKERAAFRAGKLDRVFSAAARHAIPVCVFPPGILPELARVASAHPDLQLVIDHLGLSQPPLMQAEADPFGRLPELLELARLPNIAVKLTALPALSSRKFPFDDIWPALHRVLNAFGPRRLVWGSDHTRTASLHTYTEALTYLRDTNEVSSADKVQLLGGSLRRLFGWVSTPVEDR